MIKHFINIFLFVLFKAAIAQTKPVAPNSLWIDKPMVTTDSAAIINAGIKEISIQELFITNKTSEQGLVYDTTFAGKWVIQYANNKMSSSFVGNFANWDPIVTRKYQKNKIVEIIGDQQNRFELTHHFDEKGVVLRTINKGSSKYETRYGFYRITYKYRDGLLQEAAYFIDSSEPKDPPYMKYTFSYLR